MNAAEKTRLFEEWIAQVSEVGDEEDHFMAYADAFARFAHEGDRNSALKALSSMLNFEPPFPSIYRAVARDLFQELNDPGLALEIISKEREILHSGEMPWPGELMRLLRLELMIRAISAPTSTETRAIVKKLHEGFHDHALWDPYILFATRALIESPPVPEDLRLILECEWANHIRRAKFHGDNLDEEIAELEGLLERLQV